MREIADEARGVKEGVEIRGQDREWVGKVAGVSMIGKRCACMRSIRWVQHDHRKSCEDSKKKH